MALVVLNHRRTWIVVSLLVAFTAALLLPGIHEGLASRQQELRVLLCARDMAEGGDWVIPHFMGEERLRKPPLMYWLVAGAFDWVGSTESLGAARAVSALSGLALVLSTFFFGRSLLGRRAAWMGALVLATSLGFLYHGRLAETDLPQTLFCSLTVMLLYRAIVEGRFYGWFWAGVTAGLGFMIKGPASVAMPVAAVLSYLLLTRMQFPAQFASSPARPKSMVTTLSGALVTVLVAALITAPWYYAVALRTAATGDQASDEIARLLTESAHRGSIFFYFYTLPARLGVWGLAWPVAVYAAWKHLRHHRGARWLLCWLASSFTILSLLSSKQNHYALLLFVPSALLIGWLLNHALPRVVHGSAALTAPFAPIRRLFYRRFSQGYLRALVGLSGLIGLAGIIAWATGIHLVWPGVVPVICSLVVVLAVAVLKGLRSSFQPSLAVATVALSLAMLVAVYQTSLEKKLRGEAVVETLVESHQPQIDRSPHIAVYGDHAAMVEWYAHHRSTSSKSLIEGAYKQLHPGDVLITTARKKSIQLSPQDPAPLELKRQADVEAAIFVR